MEEDKPKVTEEKPHIPEVEKPHLPVEEPTIKPQNKEGSGKQKLVGEATGLVSKLGVEVKDGKIEVKPKPFKVGIPGFKKLHD